MDVRNFRYVKIESCASCVFNKTRFIEPLCCKNDKTFILETPRSTICDEFERIRGTK